MRLPPLYFFLMVRIAILFFTFLLASSECYSKICHHTDESLKNNILSIHEDTVGCCNAEKIFIVSQELEDSTIIYDGSYQKIPFPNGDINPSKGVCTDLIIRALRIALNYDLQKEVYLFRKAQSLPTDTNIDHRQCKKLVPFFEHLVSIGIVEKDKDYIRKGSIVFIMGDKGSYAHTLIYLGDGYMIHNDGKGQIIEKMPMGVDYVSYHFI